MPITIPPISRRRFLQSTAALAGTAAVPGLCWGDDEVVFPDPHRLALFSDTHIDLNPAATGGRDKINMTDYLNRCLSQVQRDGLPGHVLVGGDVAFGVGRKDDYVQFQRLILPILEKGVPVHCLLGNHDNYENFFEAGAAAVPDAPEVTGKHVSVVETPRANWLLLDSLLETGVVSGELGEAQLGWLAETVEALGEDKPVLVMLHHNFDWIQADGTDYGLLDAEAFFELLAPLQQVKAVFYGHSHKWEHSQRAEGVYMINLPPTSYVFERGRPFGWVDCLQAEGGLTLTLNCLDTRHQQHGEQVELEYR